MEKVKIESPLMARWRVVHTDYVMAHEQYLQAKLRRNMEQEQPAEAAVAQSAYRRLEAAQHALQDFFNTHAELRA